MCFNLQVTMSIKSWGPSSQGSVACIHLIYPPWCAKIQSLQEQGHSTSARILQANLTTLAFLHGRIQHSFQDRWSFHQPRVADRRNPAPVDIVSHDSVLTIPGGTGSSCPSAVPYQTHQILRLMRETSEKNRKQNRWCLHTHAHLDRTLKHLECMYMTSTFYPNC